MLPKANRIPSKFIPSLRVRSPYFTYSEEYLRLLYYKDLNITDPQFAVIVPKRIVSKSTKRNLVKRQINFVIMQNKNNFPLGYYVFILKKPISKLSKKKLYEKINFEIVEILSKIPKC